MWKFTTIASFITITVVSCSVTKNGKNNGNTGTLNLTELRFDTSKIAIISPREKWPFPFDNTYKPAILTQNDLRVIDSLLLVCVADYNISLDSSLKWRVIDLKKETNRMQLVPATNANGEKEVWVNCFCLTFLRNWKTNLQLIADGGSCFFHLKINLDNKKYYDLVVNGIA